MQSDQARLLDKILRTKQAQYATTLAEDMHTLSNMQPSNALEGPARRSKMALQVRIGEKEILQSILAMLESPVTNGSMKRPADGNPHDLRQSKTPRV